MPASMNFIGFPDSFFKPTCGYVNKRGKLSVRVDWMKYSDSGIQFLIMAGGKGTRFGDQEKCMQKINGKSILENLIDSLMALSHFITVSTTARHTKTIEFCRSRHIPTIITEGKDYTDDLWHSIVRINRIPIIVMGSDTYITDLARFRSVISSPNNPAIPIVDILQNNTFSGISVFNRIPEKGETLEYHELNSEKNFSLNINTQEDLNRLKLILSQETPGHFP
jgi:GTP:adenosylcobinamide-phosphate guanylyltransferase